MDGPETAPVAEAAVFRFLDLPAELRNTIYVHCVEESFPGLGEESDYDSDKDVIWAGFTEDFYRFGREHRIFTGLTQVCRQIRTEYLPLYTRRTTFAVKLEDLPRYIDIFVKLPGVADKDVVGNIVVYAGFVDTATTRLDMGALMRLGNEARSLKIEWHDGWNLTSVFEAFLHLDDYPLLRKYIGESLTKIEVQHNTLGGLDILLSIREESWEDWMVCEDDYHLWSLHKDAKVEWAASVHLPYPLPAAACCIVFV